MKKSSNRAAKLLLMLLAAALMLSMAACGGSGNFSEPDKSSSAEEAGTKVSQEFLDSLKGLEMRITYPWKVEDRGASSDADIMWANVDKINQQYGCNINLVSGRATYTQVMVTSLIANKPMGEILMCQDNYFADWYNAGIFADLTAPASEVGIDFSAERFHKGVIDYSNVNNQQCGYYYGYDVSSSIFYNKRLLTEAGLEDPFALYDKDEWTYAKLAEYAKLLKKTDSNGNVEVWGLGAWSSSDFLANCITSNDSTIVAVGADGKPKINLSDSKTLEAMEWMYKLCFVDKTLDAIDPPSWEGKMLDFIDGKYAMLLGTNSTLNFCYRNGMQDEYGVITFPKGPSNISGNTECMTNITFFFIPTMYQDKAAQFLFLHDKLSQADNRTPEESYAQTYALRLADKRSYDQYYERMHKNPNFELIYFSGCMWTSPGIGEISGSLASGTSTAGALSDMYSTPLQSALDDKWARIKITGNIN